MSHFIYAILRPVPFWGVKEFWHILFITLATMVLMGAISFDIGNVIALVAITVPIALFIFSRIGRINDRIRNIELTLKGITTHLGIKTSKEFNDEL